MLEQLWQGLEEQSGLPPLVVVVGDHGMAEGGSHGGASREEVLVPLVLLGGSLGQGGEQEEELLQVDLVPMLALLTGVPIPSTR